MELKKLGSIESIQNISLNPFFLSLIIQYFLCGYKKEINIHLLYLIFPIIFYKPSREFLISANSRSTLFTMFFDDIDSRVLLGGIQERYRYFKEITNEAIIVAVNEKKIAINETVVLIEKVDFGKIKEKEVKKYFRAAHYLGILFSKMHYIDIFRRLGVKSI